MIGEAVVAVTPVRGTGGYVRAGDVVLWGIPDERTDAAEPGARLVVSAMTVVAGVPTATLSGVSGEGYAGEGGAP